MFKLLVVTCMIMLSSCRDITPEEQISNWISKQADTLICQWESKWGACFCSGDSRWVTLMVVPDKFCKR